MTKMIQNNDEIIHSDEVQEVLTAVPAWMTRWGITLCLLMLAGIVCLSVFIRYPETIRVEVRFVGEVPANPFLAEGDGQVEDILAADGALVLAGQPVLRVRNATGQSAALTADKNGKIRFIAVAEKGSLIKQGQEVFVVLSERENYYGVIELDQQGRDKVELGQKVVIRSVAPFQEAQQEISGRISYLTNQANSKGWFLARVNFANQPAIMRNGMVSTGTVFLNNQTLFERISKYMMEHHHDY